MGVGVLVPMSDRIESLLNPLARTVLEEVAEGVVVFDSVGRLAYANRAGRAVVGRAGVADGDRAGVLPKLSRLGSRIVPLWIEGSKVGELVLVPMGGDAEADADRHTLAERERDAIVETLQATGWKLTESARQLGISRTTLWRRLRAYGLDRDTRGRWSRSS
jgi:transcriptional regulator of acetoin/glycerol metabolism